MAHLYLLIHGFIQQIFVEQLLYAKHVGEWYDFTLPRTAEDKSLLLGKIDKLPSWKVNEMLRGILFRKGRMNWVGEIKK